MVMQFNFHAKEKMGKLQELALILYLSYLQDPTFCKY